MVANARVCLYDVGVLLAQIKCGDGTVTFTAFLS